MGRLIAFALVAVFASSLARAEEEAADGSKDRPYVISAKKLLEEWKANEVKAEVKYKGKWVAVSGRVREVKRSMGRIVVTLEGLSGFSGVFIEFPESAAEDAASLDKGVDTAILCRVTGKTMGSVHAEDGGIAKPPAEEK